MGKTRKYSQDKRDLCESVVFTLFIVVKESESSGAKGITGAISVREAEAKSDTSESRAAIPKPVRDKLVGKSFSVCVGINRLFKSDRLLFPLP